jgi:hypothetical protein
VWGVGFPPALEGLEQKVKKYLSGDKDSGILKRQQDGKL